MTAIERSADSLIDSMLAAEQPSPDKPAPIRVKSKPEAEREGVKAIYLQVVGRPYAAVPQDHAAWTELKKVATIAEIEEFWRFSLARPATDWLHTPTIWQLKRKWNDIATLLAKTRPVSSVAETYTCEACRAVVDVVAEGRRRDVRGWLCPPCFRVPS